MAPLTLPFSHSTLATQIQYEPNGRKRKGPEMDLKQCDLKELLQYNCNLQGPKENPKSKVVCEPIQRLFRKCANGITVETTAWEDVYD